ncbi:MAG: urease accessory UreF family protein [Cyanobacteria bacterium J06621_11]
MPTNLTRTDPINQQLVLLQLADSFFPSGSYTLSHGLESLVQSGAIATSAELETFIRILLCNKVGSTDLVASAHTHRASTIGDIELIKTIDARLFAQTPIEKTRIAARQSGRALLMVAKETWPHAQLEQLHQATMSGELNCLHPIIFAVVAQIAGLDERSTLTAFMHSFTTGLLGASIRLGVVGHLQAQQIRCALNEDMAEVCEEARVRSLDEMWSCTPTIDLAQMQQAKLSRRLFSS